LGGLKTKPPGTSVQGGKKTKNQVPFNRQLESHYHFAAALLAHD